MSGRDAAGGGLITWAHWFAAKKWPFFELLGGKRTSWTYPAENGPHSRDGRPHFPAGPTRADSRIGRCGPLSGDAVGGPRSGVTRLHDATGQSRCHRLASG